MRCGQGHAHARPASIGSPHPRRQVYATPTGSQPGQPYAATAEAHRGIEEELPRRARPGAVGRRRPRRRAPAVSKRVEDHGRRAAKESRPTRQPPTALVGLGSGHAADLRVGVGGRREILGGNRRTCGRPPAPRCPSRVGVPCATARSSCSYTCTRSPAQNPVAGGAQWRQ